MSAVYLYDSYDGDFDPTLTLADFSRQTLADLGREYLLAGHLIDRVGIPLFLGRFGVDDQAGAIVMPFRNSGQGVRQVESNHDQRRRDLIQSQIIVVIKARSSGLHRLGLWPIRKRTTRPKAGLVVTRAAACRKPDTIHLQQPDCRVLRVFHVYETNLGTLTVCELIEHLLEIVRSLTGSPSISTITAPRGMAALDNR